jgi:spore germination cell wall hydrolase CwlJ-like protein
MNKNKRALMSMIVFLSVFCLSAIFNIPNNLTTKENAHTGTRSQETTEPDATAVPSTDDNEIESFSYKTSSIVTTWENPYMATESSAETTDIQENAVSANNGDTSESKMSTEGAVEAAVAENPQINITEEIEQEVALYANIGISIAKEYVNIREKASTDSEVLGKLYKNSAVEILETSGDWYHVESGSVKGYVKEEFIQTGIPDEELVEKYGEPSIVVTVDGLNVREKADTESDKVAVIYRNEIYPVLDGHDDWIKINIPEDKTAGYVKSDYAELMVDFKDAISKEEEAELLKLQAEERAKKETEIKKQDSVSYSQEDLKLLACLVHSEAGTQSYEGKLAVANVVLNRVKSSKYGGSIKSVIYQPGQFSVANSGSLAKQLSNYDNYRSNSQQLSVKAAKAALEGSNNIGSRLYFHSYKAAVRKGYDKKKTSVKLGDHLFW